MIQTRYDVAPVGCADFTKPPVPSRHLRKAIVVLQVIMDVRAGEHSQQRMMLEAEVAHVDVSASPWQLSDMSRLALAASWMQRRAQYAHLRPAALDAFLGIGNAQQSHASVMAQQGAAGDAALPSWSDVWRFATLAIRSDLRECVQTVQARAHRGQHFLACYSAYIGACSLLYAARTIASQRAAGSPPPSAQQPDGPSNEAEQAAQAFVDHELVDLEFFAWVHKHAPASCKAKQAQQRGEPSAAAGSGQPHPAQQLQQVLQAAACRRCAVQHADVLPSRNGCLGIYVVTTGDLSQTPLHNNDAQDSAQELDFERSGDQDATAASAFMSLVQLAAVSFCRTLPFLFCGPADARTQADASFRCILSAVLTGTTLACSVTARVSSLCRCTEY